MILPQQCLLRQGMFFFFLFSGKGPGQILLEKLYNLTLRYMNICAYWDQF